MIFLLILFNGLNNWANPLDREAEFYKIFFQTLEGKTEQMSKFAGRKLIIVAFDGSLSDTTFLKSLDTLYQNEAGSLGIIAIPIKDLSVNQTPTNLKAKMRDSLNIHFTVLKLSTGKGDKRNGQHPLLQWTTDRKFNSHFNDPITKDGEMYVFNGNGTMYAKLSKGVNPTGRLMRAILDSQ